MAVEKAYFEILRGAGKGTKVAVHFNPQSLQITYRSSGPDGSQQSEKAKQTQGAAKQPTGNVTELSMDLLFDTTQTDKDVRGTTIKIATMLQASVKAKQPAAEVPQVRFHWGTFIFAGNVTSVSETIDFFSERGVPLRSTVKLSMTEVQEQRGNPGVLVSIGIGVGVGIGLSASAGVSAGVSAEAGFSASASLSAGVDIGTTPLTLAQAGDSLQALAGRAGVGASWKAVAAANNIDNPRNIPAGTPINLSAGASASASANFDNGTASASASANFGA